MSSNGQLVIMHCVGRAVSSVHTSVSFQVYALVTHLNQVFVRLLHSMLLCCMVTDCLRPFCKVHCMVPSMYGAALCLQLRNHVCHFAAID